MAAEVQKVVVIQDASKDIVSSSAIKWVLQGLLLKPGDELTLLAVLHQVINPSTLSFMAAGRLCKNLFFVFLIKGRKNFESMVNISTN